MGNNFSKFAPAAKEFHYSMDPGEEVKVLEAVETQFAGGFFCLEVSDWASEEKSYRLRLENRLDDDGFSDSLNWLADNLQLFFWMPAGYEGGPEGLLHRIKRLFEESKPLGIIHHAFGARAIDKIRNGQPANWYRTGKRVSGCSCRREKIHESGHLLFKITADNNIPVGLLVNPTNLEYCELVGEQSPSLFFDVMALPVRLWQRIHLWYSQFHEARRVNDESIFDKLVYSARVSVCAIALNTGYLEPIIINMEANENWWHKIFHGLCQRVRALGDDWNRWLLLQPSLVRGDDGMITIEKIEAHTESKDAATRNVKSNAGQTKQHQALYSISATGDEEHYRLSFPTNSLLESRDAHSKDCEILNPQEQRNRKKRMRGKKRHLKKIAERQKTRRISSSATENVPRDVSPDYVVDDVAIPSTSTAALNHDASPESDNSCTSFKTAPDDTRQSKPLAVLESSVVPTPSACSPVHTSWLQTLPEGLEEEVDEADSGASTPRCHPPPKSPEQQHCPPDRKAGMSEETRAVALPESEIHQSQVTAIDAPTREGISTRSDRESPSPGPRVDSSAISASLSSDFRPTQPVDTLHMPTKPSDKEVCKKGRSTRRKQSKKRHDKGRNDQPAESAPEPDNSQQALSPDEESQRRNVDAQDKAVTDASSAQSQITTLAVPTPPVPASTEDAAKSDSDDQRDFGIAVPAAAFLSTGVKTPSDACAEDISVDTDTETLKNSPRKEESLTSRSADAQAAPSAPVTPSQARQGEASDGATLTRTPSTHGTVALTVGCTQGGIPMRAALFESVPRIVTSTGPADAGASPVSQKCGFGPPAVEAFAPGAPTSRQHAATPAVRAVATGPGGGSCSSSTSPPTALNSGADTAPTPTTTPSSHGNFERVEKLTYGQPIWDLTTHSFECAMLGCVKMCNLWDGSSVICPRCGPYSQIRYCGKEHQREDIKWHWTYCGQEQYTFKHRCAPASVPADIVKGPPMLPCIHGWDSPERQRQALWFSTGRQEGDYFIFSDWNDQFNKGAVPGSLDNRCSSRVIQVIVLNDPEEKDRFRRILAVCLFAALEHQKLVDYLFRMIRDTLRLRGQWNGQVDVMLRQQFKYEMGVTLRPSITGDRHACAIEWSGKSRRHCQDPICRYEDLPVLLGRQARLGHGFDRLCTAMEAEYWVLRANRTTHPTCQEIEARIHGEGYGDDVAPRDRRAFRRGEGWDGAGTGPMEIEGPDWRAIFNRRGRHGSDRCHGV